MATKLESLQEAFANALDAPEQEQPLLAHVNLSSSAPKGSAQVKVAELSEPRSVAADSNNSIRQRLALYRGNVRSRWRSALANAYPVLLALVGDSYFDALSLAYARAHPSCSGDLNRFGDALPAFIGEYERHPTFRYFADVARLEWALHVAYFAGDITAFTPQQWLELGDERLLDARLVVHPASAAIASDFAIADIWLSHQPGGAFPRRIDVPSWTLVVRPMWQPTILIHSEAAHAAFVALQGGKSLGEALDSAFVIDPAFDFVKQWHVWISASAITGAAD